MLPGLASTDREYLNYAAALDRGYQGSGHQGYLGNSRGYGSSPADQSEWRLPGGSSLSSHLTVRACRRRVQRLPMMGAPTSVATPGMR
eukprot:1398723-Rhodomonas_salina.1